MSAVKRSRGGKVWTPCANVAELQRWTEHHLHIHVPDRAVCPGHQAPMEYLRRTYFEPAGDLVVWAPRGGGKTRLGALATLLDVLHKPGCQVRILGGSLEQSLRLWEHLMPDVLELAEKRLEGKPKARSFRLKNGAGAAVVTQSQRAVRGLRVQKLRCDEVDMFDPQVWEAGKLVVKSRQWAVGSGQENDCRLPTTDRPLISGVVEALSTWHRPAGLMQNVVEQAQANGTPVIRWCLMEVLEQCPPDRTCAVCPLLEECAGAAKDKCAGFIGIDDAIAMKRRVSKETWEAEMLCRRPSVRGCVFPSFDESVHVTEEVGRGQWAVGGGELWLGVDFGFANPFICLWVRAGEDGSSYVLDEYVQEGRTVEEHIKQMDSRPWGKVHRLACDPAGAGRNEQTAMSNVQLLRRRGYTVRYRSSRIVDGLERIRSALRPGYGAPKLFIHPRCQRLIASLRGYRYAETGSELPVKDGVHDHAVDALRYYFVNRDRGEVVVRAY